ncbi:MAG: glutamine--fructose-6-phosphate transaminase (isomerizing) [Candidatus Gracilibacteria bacterium]|jgi:glucosamine--fructose-6-phosphate aminotransferase (isomerizing)
MCGIFAYIGPTENGQTSQGQAGQGQPPKAAAIVLKGLKKLEYRGYDSWGIAAKLKNGASRGAEAGEIVIEKHVGKISEVEKLEDKMLGESSLAIGHSRWATHGGVTNYNAHPHTSEDGRVVVVHNGIFENFLELKEDLIAKGHQFRSETDTEIFAHLIEEKMHAGLNFLAAFKASCKMLTGRYAVVAIHRDENMILAARRGSPLIVGKGQNGEYFVASDVPAFLEYTKDIMYLDDNQMVVLDREGASAASAAFFNLETDEKIEKRVISIDWKEEMAEKGAYPHFMIKEIMEQKESLARAINTDEALIQKAAQMIKSAYGTTLVGCGTAGKVAMMGEYFFAEIAKKHVNTKFGSEFKSARHFLTDRSLVIAVSQSGETADTLEALETAKARGAKIISIVNVETSTMARISDLVIPLKAGPEKAVASTKATTSQIAILILLAYAVSGDLNEGKRMLVEVDGKLNDMLNPRYEKHIEGIAEQIKNAQDIIIIGRDLNYPVALESAIKLQEVSYIHAEGFAGGELKHGPIALVSEGTPCIVIAPNDEFKAEILGNAMELKARGAKIIGVSPENAAVFDIWIRVPMNGYASPIMNLIPIQMLAYKLAVIRENNPDMPRNLAKSVTVK